MGRGINEYHDHSGEAIGEVVADILLGYQDEVLTPEIIEAVRQDVAAAIGIVGVKEVAEIMGITRPRVSQLKSEGSKRLPKPIATLASSQIWLKQHIEEAAWES